GRSRASGVYALPHISRCTGYVPGLPVAVMHRDARVASGRECCADGAEAKPAEWIALRPRNAPGARRIRRAGRGSWRTRLTRPVRLLRACVDSDEAGERRRDTRTWKESMHGEP